MTEKPYSESATIRLAVVGTGIVVSFMLFSSYIIFPPVGFVFGLLAPFPVMVIRFRNSWRTALVATLVTNVLLAGVLGVQAGVLYLAQCGVIGLLLPELLIREYGAARSIAWTTSVNLVAYLLMASIFICVSDLSLYQLHELVLSEIGVSTSQALAIYEKAGIKGNELVAMKMALARAANLTIRIYPALATVMLIVISGCNLAVTKLFSIPFGINLKVDHFREFRNPDLMIWLLIAAGFAMLIDVKLVTISALNILVVLGVLYFLQGMAVISSMFFRAAASTVWRFTLYLLLIVQPYTVALVVAVGIFDLWCDFRAPRKQENL